MEKAITYTAIPRPTMHNKEQHKNKLVVGFVVLASILNVAYSWYGNRLFSEPVTEVPPLQDDDFSWSQLQATKYINYTLCFGKFGCSRLDVPMDYDSTNLNGSRVMVAVIRYPAPVPVTDPRYAGPVLINPGGPGGSGVAALMEDAELISSIVNPALSSSSNADAKFYDIVSW